MFSNLVPQELMDGSVVFVSDVCWDLLCAAGFDSTSPHGDGAVSQNRRIFGIVRDVNHRETKLTT